ncbi:MAG: MBL fold metallo-hydrolase [Deltaproteobacteria bacterium]|nr:MBL fold metallo-hydrolase [Deltaproteobacteria bacterium]
MLSWKIGDVTVTRVVESEIVFPNDPKGGFLGQASPAALREMPWLWPHFVTEEGHLRISMHALLVEAPRLTLVVDTCVGNDKPRALTGGVGLATRFLEDLESTGCRRESVNAVVCTHLHVDHVGWNTMWKNGRWVPTFPNARYLIGRQEYAHWKADRDPETRAILADSLQPIFDARLAELVDMNHRLSPEIRLVPTPGHTPGHVSVAIESRGQQALITGDFLHHPCQLGHPEWSPAFDSDPIASASTRRSMLEKVADRPVLVIGTHFAAPTAGHVQRAGRGFRFEVGEEPV